MLALAASRRSGHHPNYTSTWGAAIGTIPGLKTFELALESFAAKTNQLDAVVECAKTWKFPIQDTQYELVHDGSVECVSWTKPAEGKKKAEEQEEAEDARASNIEPATQDNNVSAAAGTDQDHTTAEPAPPPSPQQEPHDDTQPSDQLLPHQEDLSSYDGLGSPCLFPDDYPVQANLRSGSFDWGESFFSAWAESWVHGAIEFEVRVVRFRRRRRVD